MEGCGVWAVRPPGPSHPSRSRNPRLETYCTDKAGVVPGVSQGFNELVPSLHREVAAVTLGAEQVDVV